MHHRLVLVVDKL